MADSVVSFVLENLSRLVAHEAHLLCDVEDKVKSLESELRMIGIHLKSSNQNQRKKEIEQEVLRQITDVAHEAEDVIDTFVAKVANQGRRGWLSWILHGVDHAKLLHHVAEKIDSINLTIGRIYENGIKYEGREEEAAGSSSNQELKLLHKRRREVEEDDVVGFENDTAEVINLLKQGGSRRDVVSIIGMGGLGKTTLARKIYKSHNVKEHFPYHAWVYVSNDYRPRELLVALLKCLITISANSSSKHKKKSKGKGKAKAEDDYYSLTEEELKDKVRECLKGKRYLVVLDDIWNPQHWDDLKDAFPDDYKGSRILITSRWKDVASHACSSPYYLPFLSEEQSWELFSKRVSGGEGVRRDLEPLGKSMVKSCGGLPISIVVLAGILAKKEKSYREWSKIMGHVNSYLTRPETQVHDIVLKLSYDSLPPILRPCFLYFGVFPEDYEIPVRRLIELWVAEGFFLPSGSRIAEDVAEDYLDELIDRSLIQVGRRRNDGGIKTCHVHDLLRELCISESKEEKVFEVCRDGDILVRTKPRRLSVQCMMSDYLVSSNKDHSGTRSLLYFDHNSYRLDSKRLAKGFQLVRVLDLGRPLSYRHLIPTNLDTLVHLRYLRIHLRGHKLLEKIPKFICNLRNLETLDLDCYAFFMRFPAEFWKLKRLRHLHTGASVILPKFPDMESKTMWNLQTLSSVAINKKSAIASLMGKGVFPKLRRLGLYCGEDRHQQRVDQVWENLPNLKDLNALKISEFPNMPTSVDAFPSNLTKLTIFESNLNNDFMRTLGSLTNLRILKLKVDKGRRHFLHGLELCCSNGFPKLEVFEMAYLNNLSRWELGKDVMPCLRRLIILECVSLTVLPDELWSLTSLQEVRLAEPTRLKNLIKDRMRDGCNLIITEDSCSERELKFTPPLTLFH